MIWRAEPVSPIDGDALDICAQVEIPERRTRMVMSIGRDPEDALRPGLNIEIMFNLPADLPFGGIADVSAILMKEAEQTLGTPLVGVITRGTDPGSFLFRHSPNESDMQRNLDLLLTRSWLDIPIAYSNGQRAILAIEKGASSDAAFKEAFAAWKTATKGVSRIPRDMPRVGACGGPATPQTPGKPDLPT